MNKQPLALLQVAVALAAAMVLSFPVRTTTAGLNDSLGRAWPFSMRHCLTSSVPGCDIGSSFLRASR